MTGLADRVLRVPEAAKLLGVGARTYYQAAARGEVPAIRVGRRLVVPGAALARLLEGDDAMANSSPDGNGAPPSGRKGRS